MADIMEIVRAAMSRSPSVDGGGNVAKGTKPPVRTATDPLTPFATFAPPSPWDRQREASKRMYDADTLVEHLGVNGNDPEVQSAAAMVHSAVQTRDMTTVLHALAEFEAVVRRVALPGGKLSKLA